MKQDLIIGLVETILNDYNTQNDTRIQFEDLNFDEIADKVAELIWCQIEFSDN